MTTKEIITILHEFKERRGHDYGIVELGLFGSSARGEQDESSDIDICIRLKKASFFSRIRIQEELEKLFGRKVDVISLGAIMRPLFRQSLEEDAIYV